MTRTRKPTWFWVLITTGLITVAGLSIYFAIQAWQNPSYTQAQIRLPDQTKVTVEVADTWRKQEHGLMGREQLTADTGMLFIFGVPAKYPFWMKDTKIDLDYVWMLGGLVVELTPQVPAGDGLPHDQIAKVAPKTEVDWVLEVPAGFIAQHQLQVGDRLVLEETLDETPPVF